MRFLSSLAAAAALALCAGSASADPVVNGSFETGTINWNGAWGAYCYSSASCAATAWSGNYLLASTGSWAWGFPGSRPGFSAGQGVVVAGLQATEYVQQTLSIASGGDYTLSWRDAGRPSAGFTYYAQDYDVSVDGTVLGTYHTEAGEAWGDQTLALSLGAGEHVLKFAGKRRTDSTTFLDLISLSSVGGNGDNGGGNNVPEPASLALISLGLLGVAGTRRRKASAA